jgi:LysM repeat protein
LAGLTILTASTIGGVALARRGGRPATPAIPSSIAITIQSGDTLWSLAKRFGDPNAYILERVNTLAAANGLASDARLMPGQRITIPISSADDFARVQAAIGR